jgi:riboflavin synthase alpha subunit
MEAEVGRRVNLEVDLLAKYVERMMAAHGPEGQQGSRITEQWLREQGML